MALTSSTGFRGLAGFSLTTANAERLAAFYNEAFGFCRVADTRLNGDTFHRLMDIESDARGISLSLGNETIELVEFDVPGKPYPTDATACDTVFQHLAIVVADMALAWSALRRTGQWTPVTAGGPQLLPESSGGVTAFKFRDPEGHPLELLSFPPDNTPAKWQRAASGRACLGIDHSAIVVSDTKTSIAFYAAHGLHESSRSHNAGPEQNRLDGLPDAVVEVTGLAPAITPPHVELLCYEKRARQAPLSFRSNDIAATCLIFQSDEAAAPWRLTDPDGHHLVITPVSAFSRFA